MGCGLSKAHSNPEGPVPHGGKLRQMAQKTNSRTHEIVDPAVRDVLRHHNNVGLTGFEPATP